MKDIRYIHLPIVKFEKTPDGKGLYVYGKCTDDSVDLDGQIVDRDFARKALGDWFKEFANVRQMHSGSLPPAGIGVDLEEKGDGFYLKTEVYEPGAVQQVQKGGYKAYSIGIALPRVIRDAKAKNGRIVDGKVVENSLVDYPANLGTKFAIVAKVGGSPEGEMQLLFKSVSIDKKQKPPKVQIHGGKGDVHVHMGQDAGGDGKDGDGGADAEEPEEDEGGAQAAVGDGSEGGNGNGDGKSPLGAMNPGFQSFYGQKQAGVMCEACKGSGQQDGEPCPDCGGKGTMSAKRAKKIAKQTKILKGMLKDIRRKAKIQKRDVSGAEREKLGDQGHAVDTGQDKPSFPISKPKDLENAVSAYGRAKPEDRAKVKQHIKDEARRLGAQDKIPEKWKEVSIKLLKRGDIETAVQVLHDLTCQVNSPDALKAMYPSVTKNGLAASLGPNAKLALWQLIQNETVEDGGSGKSSTHLRNLGIAYDALEEFLASETAPEIMFAAQEELHKAFLEVNKDILSSGGNPLPGQQGASFGSARGTLGEEYSLGSNAGLGDGILSSSPTIPSAENAKEAVGPEKYRRAFLGAGHQRETGDGQGASPWRPAAVEPISASDFTGQGGAPGTARPSPANTKRSPLDLSQQLHDTLVLAFPSVGCYLEPSPGPVPMTTSGPSTNGNGAGVVLGKEAKAGLNKMAVVGKKKAVKKLKAKLEKKLRKKIVKQLKAKAIKEGSGAVAPAPSTEGASAGGEGKEPVPAPPKKKDKGKAKMAKIKAAKKFKKVRKQLASFKKSNAKLVDEVRKIGGEPDPRYMPTRREALHKGLTAEAQKRKTGAVEADVQKRRELLQDQAINSPDAQTRDRAQLELMGLEPAAQ